MTSTPSQRYRANTPSVIFEAFDDETVLINLDSGNYYSFCGSGAFLWELITSGQTSGEIVTGLENRFPAQAGQIEGPVDRFIGELMAEGLITLREAGAPAGSIESREANNSKLTEFEKPTLVKYSDMAELLLLDPIHEVDETGWPRAIELKPKDVLSG
jgi:Coenzyme PQQ synthesis protein D (PqqD)